MGNICVCCAGEVVVEDVKSRQPESEPTKNTNSDDVFVQVWKKDSDPIEFWLNDGLSKGSAISVGIGIPDNTNFFVWERNCQCPEPRWRFRSDKNDGLYITYDESDNLTMEPDKGENSIFYVNAGMQGGHIFQVPSKQKFIAEVSGKLVLSDTPAEWTLDPSNQKELDGDIKNDILIVTENLTGRKWTSKSPAHGEMVVLDVDYQESAQAQWIGQFRVKEGAWNFQPKQNPSVFVTCENETSEIALQTGSNENIKERLISTNGYVSITMQDSSGEKYFCSKPLGETNVLSLTSHPAKKSEWRVYVYAFDIDGDVYPPDPRTQCGKKTENTHVPITLSQEPAESTKYSFTEPNHHPSN